MFHRRIVRRLHEDRLATLGHWGRLEQSLAAGDERQIAWLLRSAYVSLDEEVSGHMTFEEREIFPRLAASGRAELAQALSEEHIDIRYAAGHFRA